MPFDEDEPTRDNAREHQRERERSQSIDDSTLAHDALASDALDDERAERESRTLLLPLQLEADRFEALAQRIEAAAASELMARSALRGRKDPSYLSLATHDGWMGRNPRGNTFASVLARAAWPALATAAAAALVAVGLTRNVSGTRQSTSTDFVAGRMLATGTTTRTLPVGKPDATWIAQQTTPSTDDLAQAIGLGVEQ